MNRTLSKRSLECSVICKSLLDVRWCINSGTALLITSTFATLEIIDTFNQEYIYLTTPNSVNLSLDHILHLIYSIPI